MSVSYPAFIFGASPPPIQPLARFLPVLPSGMVSALLQQTVPTSAWLIDPMASTPQLALEAARAGYRILVVCNNPILSFILEVLASAPAASELQAALSELTSSRRGEERLESHLQSLYLTECPNCNKRIQVAGYIWKKDDPAPIQKQINCPFCHSEGEFPVTSFDLEHIQPPGNPNLLRARSLERVAGPDADSRAGTLEALRSYLPRPLYFITTLINKIEGLVISEDRKKLLTALALSVCDKGNTLWAHSSGRSRPRQLTTPPEFREEALWAALEGAVEDWSNQPNPVPLTHYPDLPPITGGICLFSGRLKNLLPLPAEFSPQLAIAIFPRPNQAFWTLSAIWSGWLWGRDAVQPLSSALARRRYDWQWHTTALHQIFGILNKHSPAEFPFLGILPELVPGFLAAALVAAQAGGFAVKQAAISLQPEIAQITWENAPTSTARASAVAPQRVIQQAVAQHLAERNEPCPYLPIYTAGMLALAENGILPTRQSQISFDTLTRIQSIVSSAFSDQSRFDRLESSSKNLESGWWWLTTPPSTTVLPLADRVEMAIVRYLIAHETCLESELESHLAAQFPGLVTPPRDLVQECLTSYADLSQINPARWQIHSAEKPSSRRDDLRAVQISLGRLAKRIGFQAMGDSPLIWHAPTGASAFFLYPMVSGIFSPAFFSPQSPPHQSILVFPENRARLVNFKIRRDPRLTTIAAQGWRFLTFRLLRTMLTRPQMDLINFEELLERSSATAEEVNQLRFF